jgi:outer membrane lipopolysaccharide assembly protein LptE/RlpB
MKNGTGNQRGLIMKNIRWMGICFLAVTVVLSGCGYTRKTVLPRNIKTIYVETVKNKLDIEQVYAYQQGLEMDITNAVVRGLQQDGTIKIAEEKKADAILKTDLLQYEQEGLRFTQLEEIKEYRIFIVVKITLVDAKTGDVIWEEPNFTGDNEYYVTGPTLIGAQGVQKDSTASVTSIGEQRASVAAVQNLATNIVSRIVEDW